MKDNLLEYMYECIHLNYLSDLKVKLIMKKHIAFIIAIPEDDFSLKAWEEACDYLFGNKNIISKSEAKKCLLQWIEE